jgi:hypothetical protein
VGQTACGPTWPVVVAFAELKIDFCGTTAIRSPIARAGATAPGDRTRVGSFVEPAAAGRRHGAPFVTLGSRALSGPTRSPGDLPEN